MAYCCLILLGKFIQRLVFGELRVSEQQHIKDKFWNFVFYKFIFVFGVINVQYMDEVVLWCSWFSVLGFLHLLAQLCKDRFEYLSFSPTTPGWSHIRLLGLLAGILVLSGFMFLICVAVGFFGGLNTFAFMVAECVQLSVQTLHVILRYALHLYDMRHGGSSGGRVWEKRGPVAYYTELIFELTALLIDLVHHLHMLLWSLYLMPKRNYHPPIIFCCSSCLQSWLEQDTSCPTCRMVLSIQSPAGLEAASRLEHNLLTGENQGDNQATTRRPPNHFFHFDGSRYVSWLPSFSVEVTHTQLLRSDQPQLAQTSQLDAMARQVQQLFPHLALATVIEDLRATRSVELTIENVLDGRVVAPPPMFQRDSEPPMQELELSPGPADSSTERERILQLRKEQLIINARRRYMERHKSESAQSESDVEASVRQRHIDS
ncbi:hypothetical protein C0J52_07636 [Blattella germanica]|nr:hypothetical protein C0J52_07636 [Blattella germanica]